MFLIIGGYYYGYCVACRCNAGIVIIRLTCIGGSRGGVPGTRHPYETQSFNFHIHFHQKAPALEIHAPQRVYAPSTGNPGSATDM